MGFPAAKDLNFSIDKYVNPWIPRNRLDRLPRPISRFLGHRDAPTQPIGNIPIALWAALGGFCGTAILSGLFMADFIKDRGGPIIIGSFGAAAILEYNAIESPFSQPRNQIGGQLLAAIIGVGITKLFALNADFESLRWLAGAIAVGLCSAVMTLTGTVHPPAGATALLAAVEPAISGLGWLYIGIVVLCSVITHAVACLLNNIHRQYPIYWWSPQETITRVKADDVEKVAKKDSGVDTAQGEESVVHTHKEGQSIHISEQGCFVPEDFYLGMEERNVLKILEERLRETRDRSRDSGSSDGHKRGYSSDGGHDTSDDGSSELSKSKSNASLPPLDLGGHFVYG